MRKTQNGNVLFLILIAVALFAALSFAVTSSSRSGGGDVSKEQAKLYASQIVQYATQMQTAIRRMELSSNVPEYGYDFSTTNSNVSTSATNGTCTDNDCKVYHPEGGGVPEYVIPLEAFDLSSANAAQAGKSQFYTMDIQELGSTAADLMLYVRPVSDAVCDAINEDVNGFAAQTEGFGGAGAYSGTLTSMPTSTAIIGDSEARYKGEEVFCVDNALGNIFMAALLVR